MAKAPTIPGNAPGEQPDAQSDAFLREVDDAYRQDRLTGFWQRYGRWILIGTGLFLVALAAFLWWREQQIATRGVQAEAFDAAVRGLDLGDTEAVSEIERFATSDVEGYSTVAAMLQAGLLVEDGNLDGAATAYRAIAGDTTVPQPVRDLATIQAVRLTFDGAEPETLVAELTPLAVPESAWFGVAGELLAAAHLKAGDNEAARSLYSDMAASDAVPASLRSRAGQLAAATSADDADTIDDELALDEPTAPDGESE
ncbi:MAG: tetratricopeptide repeat protein [Pseudomonadota bacterium]